MALTMARTAGGAMLAGLASFDANRRQRRASGSVCCEFLSHRQQLNIANRHKSQEGLDVMPNLDLPLRGEPAGEQSDLHANYEVGASIGKGAYGEVFQARHRETGVMRAVKCGSSFDRKFTQTFLGEVRALAALDHQHIVSFVDYFLEEGQFYLVEELCGRHNLLDYLLQSPSTADGVPRVPSDAAAGIIRQCLVALGHCHARGLVHRDVKLENFMISDAGTVKLIDFGLAVPATGSGEVSLDAPRPSGTVRYMAPEALQWAEPTAAMDMWSLGACLFVLLTGELLFKTQDYKKARECLRDVGYARQRIMESDLSDSAQDLLLKMLQHDPGKRISVCDALCHPFVFRYPCRHLE